MSKAVINIIHCHNTRPVPLIVLVIDSVNFASAWLKSVFIKDTFWVVKATVKAILKIFWRVNLLLEDSFRTCDKFNFKSLEYSGNLSLYSFNIVIFLIRNIYRIFAFLPIAGV